MIGRVLAAAYVTSVAVLTAIAFSGDTDRWPAEIAAALLGLPLVVPALPVIYVLGGLAWNGPMWLAPLTFTSLMTAVACGNVWLLRAVVRALAPTRSGA